jgi:hypothetical protein
LILSRKYKIEEIGISSPQYLAGKIEDFLLDSNYKVKRQGELIKFRLKFQNQIITGQFIQGYLHIYVSGDKLIIDFHITNFYFILLGVFSIGTIILLILISLQLIPPGIIVFGLLPIFPIIFNGLYHYFDARKKLYKIDELVWSLT